MAKKQNLRMKGRSPRGQSATRKRSAKKKKEACETRYPISMHLNSKNGTFSARIVSARKRVPVVQEDKTVKYETIKASTVEDIQSLFANEVRLNNLEYLLHGMANEIVETFQSNGGEFNNDVNAGGCTATMPSNGPETLQDCVIALNWLEQIGNAIEKNDIKAGILASMKFTAFYCLMQRRSIERDIWRGNRVLHGAKLGHRAAHGSAEAKAQERAEILERWQEVFRNKETHNKSHADGIVAREFGKCAETVARYRRAAGIKHTRTRGA